MTPGAASTAPRAVMNARRFTLLPDPPGTSCTGGNSCDRLALVVARSIAFAPAALDFTEFTSEMVVGSMAADTYFVTHRDPPRRRAAPLFTKRLAALPMSTRPHSTTKNQRATPRRWSGERTRLRGQNAGG